METPRPESEDAAAAAAPGSAGALRCLSSMATRQVLADLAARYRAERGDAVELLSLGGVEAARRVAAGEAFDVVVLAADALAALAGAGHLQPGSLRAVAVSDVVAAVPAGTPAPPFATQAQCIDALRAAAAIGYSTGPSGTALLALWQRAGVLEALRPRLVQAPPGVPVGELLVQGRVAIGFQQRSELVHHDGVQRLEMPPGHEIVTVFSAGVAARSPFPARAAAFVTFLQSPAAAQALLTHGMAPPARPAAEPEGHRHP